MDVADLRSVMVGLEVGLLLKTGSEAHRPLTAITHGDGVALRERIVGGGLDAAALRLAPKL